MNGNAQPSVLNRLVWVSGVMTFIFPQRNHAERKREMLLVVWKRRFEQHRHRLTIALDHLGIQVMLILKVDGHPLFGIDPLSNTCRLL